MPLLDLGRQHALGPDGSTTQMRPHRCAPAARTPAAAHVHAHMCMRMLLSCANVAHLCAALARQALTLTLTLTLTLALTLTWSGRCGLSLSYAL